VVLFDAPPTIGHNLRRAVDEIAAAEGTTNKVTHLVYSHHHADHAGAANLFGDNVVRIGHEDTHRLLLRDNDPTRPAPDVTFQDTYTLKVGGERVELAFHGPNHSPDNIFIHFPDHDALMLVDIVNPGWVPIFNLNLSEDVPGYIDAPGQALTYPWKHYVGGHLGRLGTRADIELHQQYINDIVESSKGALGKVDPTPYFVKYGSNVWAAVKGYLGEVTELATQPVVAKYTGVLASADVEEFTYSTAFMIMQSMRLDLGAGSQVHP
jgi:glyoxylase-like metal-dependent hydrolase (beta-lactamase superfamily II)